MKFIFFFVCFFVGFLHYTLSTNAWPVLVVKLQCITLWETVGKVDWFDAYWRFPPNHCTSGNFFAYCRFCLYLHTAYYILRSSQIGVYCSYAVFENSHSPIFPYLHVLLLQWQLYFEFNVTFSLYFFRKQNNSTTNCSLQIYFLSKDWTCERVPNKRINLCISTTHSELSIKEYNITCYKWRGKSYTCIYCSLFCLLKRYFTTK